MQPIKTVSSAQNLAPNQPPAPSLGPQIPHGERTSASPRDPLFPNDTTDEIVPEPSPKAKRSIAKWAMLLVVLAAIAAIVSIAMNQRSVGHGAPGGDNDSLPNKPTDFRPR